jgi:hypothetical protein
MNVKDNKNIRYWPPRPTVRGLAAFSAGTLVLLSIGLTIISVDDAGALSHRDFAVYNTSLIAQTVVFILIALFWKHRV